MFCYKCGKILADNALFCTKCGTKVGNIDMGTKDDGKPEILTVFNVQSDGEHKAEVFETIPDVNNADAVKESLNVSQSDADIDEIIKSVEEIIEPKETEKIEKIEYTEKTPLNTVVENDVYDDRSAEARKIVPNYASKPQHSYAEPVAVEETSNAAKIISWVLIGLIFIVSEALLFLFVDFKLGTLFNFAVMACDLIVCVALAVIVGIAFAPEKGKDSI